MKKCVFAFSRLADRAFEKLPKSVQNRILDKIEFWQKQKNVFDHAAKMHGCTNLYRFRMGDYRIICQKEDNGNLIVLVVVKIGHRKDVYRK